MRNMYRRVPLLCWFGMSEGVYGVGARLRVHTLAYVRQMTETGEIAQFFRALSDVLATPISTTFQHREAVLR